jgi:hypothetical protein
VASFSELSTITRGDGWRSEMRKLAGPRTVVDEFLPGPVEAADERGV